MGILAIQQIINFHHRYLKHLNIDQTTQCIVTFNIPIIVPNRLKIIQLCLKHTQIHR